MVLDTFKTPQVFAWKEAMVLLQLVCETHAALLAGRVALMDSVYATLARAVSARDTTPTMVAAVTEGLGAVTAALLGATPLDSPAQQPALGTWLEPLLALLRTPERQTQATAATCIYAIVQGAPAAALAPAADTLATALVHRLRAPGCAVHDTVYACLTVLLAAPGAQTAARAHVDALVSLALDALRAADFRARFAAAKFLTFLNVTFPATCRGRAQEVLAALERVRYDRNADVRTAVKECLASYGAHARASASVSASGRNYVSVADVSASSSSSASDATDARPPSSPLSAQPPLKKKATEGGWAARLELNPQHVYRRLSTVEVEQIAAKEAVERYMAEKDAELAQLRARVARLEDVVLRLLHDASDSVDEGNDGDGDGTSSTGEAPRTPRRSLATADSSAWCTAMAHVCAPATAERGFAAFLDAWDVEAPAPRRTRELQSRLLRLMQVAGPERAAQLTPHTAQRLLARLFASDSVAVVSSPLQQTGEQVEEEDGHGDGSTDAEGVDAPMFSADDFATTVMPWLEQLAERGLLTGAECVCDADTAARLRAFLERFAREQLTNPFRNVAELILSESRP